VGTRIEKFKRKFSGPKDKIRLTPDKKIYASGNNYVEASYDCTYQIIALEVFGLVGLEIVPAQTPNSNPILLLKITLGRRRNKRHILSNGEYYYDVHGHPSDVYRRLDSRVRSWGHEIGPWKIVLVPQKRQLNRQVQKVVRAVWNFWWIKETKA